MSKFDELVDFIKKPFRDPGNPQWSWAAEGKKAFAAFLSSGERYYAKTYDENGKKLVSIRSPGTDMNSGIPYVALIQPNSDPSGSYDGTSLVLFPSETKSSLLTLCVGTDGINADAEALSRPGHARRLKAIADYLNAAHRLKKPNDAYRVAWAKKDPCAIEQNLPTEWLGSILSTENTYERAVGKTSIYNPLLYFMVNTAVIDADELKEALSMLMDIMLDIRGAAFSKSGDEDRTKLERCYFPYLFPNLTKDDVIKLLEDRHYVIIQGPPGTGKTHMVTGENGLNVDFGTNMRSIQFHPNTTYESFIGGLFPVSEAGGTGFGFKFKPKPGVLMECALSAKMADQNQKNYLLHIDEINRADLSKVLGEAIFLFEHKEERTIPLEHDYEGEYGNKLTMPKNLFIIGTMNTADKSVAPIDIAIRRRFAFVDLYPQLSLVSKRSKKGNEMASKAFQSLLKVFVDYASEESFKYLPGHSYFMTDTDEEFKTRMRTEVIPLLNEYLEEGLVSSMATQIEDYIQQYRSVCM